MGNHNRTYCPRVSESASLHESNSDFQHNIFDTDDRESDKSFVRETCECGQQA